MPQDTFLVPVPPQHLSGLRGWNVTPAHLAYRIGHGPRLLRVGGNPGPQGGLMVLDHQGFDGLGGAGSLPQEILRECQARRFSGAVLDFERSLPPLEALTARLDEVFRARGWALYVTEAYAARAPHARVMIPSALSGGSLAQRLKEACERFGPDRVALALDLAAEDFRLPSPSGCGTPLTPEALAEQRARLRPSIFFSPELCARYYTYMDRNSGAHFVLFDDGDTLCRKVEAAHRAGIRRFLLPWTVLEAHGPSLGISRTNPSPAARRERS